MIDATGAGWPVAESMCQGASGLDAQTLIQMRGEAPRTNPVEVVNEVAMVDDDDTAPVFAYQGEQRAILALTIAKFDIDRAGKVVNCLIAKQIGSDIPTCKNLSGQSYLPPPQAGVRHVTYIMALSRDLLK